LPSNNPQAEDIYPAETNAAVVVDVVVVEEAVDVAPPVVVVDSILDAVASEAYIPHDCRKTTRQPSYDHHTNYRYPFHGNSQSHCSSLNPSASVSMTTGLVFAALQ